MKHQIEVDYTYLSTSQSISLKVPIELKNENLPNCTLEELARDQIPQHINTWTKHNAQVPIINVVFKLNGKIIHKLDELMKQQPIGVVRISAKLMKNKE